MNITDYTSYSEIRAMFGVAELELENTVLALPVFAHHLELDLLDISENVETVFLTVQAVPEGSRTVNEKSFYALFRLFCTYAVCMKLLASTDMFSFKRATDGKAEKERFEASDDVRDGIAQGFSAIGKRLKGALAKLDPSYTAPTAVTLVVAAAVGLAINPVTGETT